VARYLSDDWFDQMGAAAEAADEPTGGRPLVMQHVVTAGPGGVTRYHVRIGAGTAQIVRGLAAEPDVTFAEDYATAAAIASGELSAPAALLQGRVRVAGDMAALLSRQAELAIAEPVPPAVRAATTY
jgi:hypothetical protein